jgi:mannose/cellobiose epimerase-like protein (N-acyl-D-glucosamine 2-epimerase family)
MTCPTAVSRLIERASTLGIDPIHGGMFDRIDRIGRIVADTKRIWPVCEMIKAQAVRPEPDPAAFRHWLDFLIRHYLRPDGRWHEILNRDLSPLLSEMPGTTPYHLLMMAEVALPALAAGSKP